MGEPKEHTYNDGRDCYIPVEVASTSIQINIRGNDDVCISGIIVNSIEIKVKPQRLGDNVNSVHGPDTSEGIEKVYKRRYTMSTYGNAIMTLPDGFDSMNGVYQIKGSTYRMPFGSSDVTTMDSALDGIEFDEVVDSIGWVKIFSCEEARSESSNKAMNFYHYDIRLALQKAAISMKIVPEGSTKNPEYDEYAVEAKPMSNPVTAVNNNLEASYVLDDDLERSDFANLDNWIGTDAAKARLSNSCGKNGNVESFEDKPYFACGNSRGLHIKKDGICRFDFGGDVGQNIEIYLGYYLPQCYLALTNCVGCLDNPHEHPDDLLPVSCNENAYKTGDEYKFRLVYDDGETSDKTWTQTSWLMEPEIKGSSLGEFGDVNSLNYFVGLGMSSSHTATFLDGNAKQGETWWAAAGIIKLQQGGIPAISQDGKAGPIAQSVQLFMCYGECDEDTETVKCSMDENDEFLNCPVERREFGFIKTGYCAEFGMWQLNQWQCTKAAEYYANANHHVSNYNLFDSSLKFDESSVDSDAKALGCAFDRESMTSFMRYEGIDRAEQDGEFCKTRKAYMWFNEEVNQATAKERCSRIPNGQLATFSDELEFMDIVKAIKNGVGADEHRMTDTRGAWIGLEDITGNNDWQFINDDHHNEYCEEYGGCANLPMWNERADNENCAVVSSMSLHQYNQDDDFKIVKGMDDYPCDSTANYVCEIFDPQIFYAGSQGTKQSAIHGLFGRTSEPCSLIPRGDCFQIKDRLTCLTGKDSRAAHLNDPCVWCGGGSCTTRNDNKCEPETWLLGNGDKMVAPDQWG